tara:strand:+ start:2022 stop:5018 length:2997 start_codon:yes stop_codon:yes gene_type:complete
MAKFTKKLSPLVSRQFPQHIQANNPLLVEFVKQYYSFMDSAQLTLSSVTDSDQILLETDTESFLALDGTDDSGNNANDYILDEEGTVGEFSKGETITGTTSGQTATILAEDTDNLKLYISANTKFVTGETVTGGTSGAQGVVGTYRANPNESISQILEYADVNDTLDDFFLQFRNSFLQTIPNDLTSDLNKRQLTKNILSLYKRKGTKKGHEIFFRALFNETPELYYPTVDLLRVSDGKFNTQNVLKATLVSPSDGDMTKLVGQTITQSNIAGNTVVNLATAVVESATVTAINLGGIQRDVATLILNKESITGTFQNSLGHSIIDETDGDDIVDEDGNKILQQTFSTITGVANDDPDVTLTCNIESISDDVTFVDRGRYYSVNENVPVSEQKGGTGLNAQIEQVSYGVIDDIIIESGGSGYAVGDALSVTNPTDGSGLAGEVAVVNGGFTIEQDSLENGVIQLEDSSTDQLVMESATNSNTNDITKIKITNKGGGYLSLPTVSVTSSSGSSVNLFPVSSSVGRALSTKVLDHGYRYEEAPVLKPKLHIQIDSITGGVPQVGETVSATQEDNIILESFKDETYSLFLEDFRQSKLRLNSEEGDILTEDGDNFVFEENNEPAVFDGAEQDVLITEAGERIIHTIYVDNGETDFMIVTHNGSTDSRLQFETTDAVTGVVESFNGDTNILTLTDQTGSFDDKVTITGGTSGNTARVRVSDPASTVSTAGTVIETDGEYSGVDGHISENTKKIQDSLYYQDYSYVVKVGEAIADWREYLKSAVHPAGFYLAGEVSVVSRIDAKLRSGRLITAGIEQDEIIEAFRVIFGEKIGRRLGTTTDGTSLRASPALGIERDVSFTTNTRDVTLNQDITIKTGDDRETSFRTTNINQGFVYAGARMDTIGKFIFGAFSHVPDRLLIDSSNGSADAGDDLILEDALFNGQIKREPASDTMDSDAATIPRINSIRLTGTGDTSLDGELNQLGDFNTRLGTRYAIPAQINTTR